MHDNIQGGALTETTFLVLLLTTSPIHGYAIMQEVSKMTNGRVKIGPGTLYGILKNLEKRDWITKMSSDIVVKKNQIQYQITKEGENVLQKEIRRLEQLSELSRKVMNGNG